MDENELVMPEMDTEREALEAELRCLHSSLDASSSNFGDWRFAKAVEKLIDEVAEAENFTEALKEWLEGLKEDYADVIAQRKTTRARINEIEEELED